MKYRIGILSTHPIQYYAPWYRALASHPEIDLEVFYCHRQNPKGQAEAGFGVEFDWDVPLLEGYRYEFLENRSRRPNVFTFFGCDTPSIAEIIRGRKFDAFIVHGWYVKSFWQAMAACWRRKTPLIVRGDSYLAADGFAAKRWLKYAAYRMFIPNFTACLAPGAMAKEYYLYYGADAKNIYLVPHIVDNEFFEQRHRSLLPERDSLRRGWNIPAGSTVFLFAGKLTPKKRPGDFLKALGLARRRNPGIFGLVAGDGPLRRKLETFSRDRSLPVTFTGFLNQQDIVKAYVASDCLVLPSGAGETWGLVVNEAFCCGLPAITSDKVGCSADLINDGGTGKKFRCGDIDQLSETMTALAGKAQILKKMGESARDAAGKYTAGNAAERLVEALRRIMMRKGEPHITR